MTAGSVPTRVNWTATADALVTIMSQDRRRSTAQAEAAPGSPASAPRRWVVRVEDVDVQFEVAGLSLPHDHVLADVATARPGADLDREVSGLEDLLSLQFEVGEARVARLL